MALMFKSQFRPGTQDDGNLSPHKVEPNFIRRFAGCLWDCSFPIGGFHVTQGRPITPQKEGSDSNEVSTVVSCGAVGRAAKSHVVIAGKVSRRTSRTGSSHTLAISG
jgi:hypothetical protein